MFCLRPTFGNIVPALFGLAIIFCMLVFDNKNFFIISVAGKIFYNFIKVGFAFFLASFVVIISTIIFVANSPYKEKPDAVIVLGAGLAGETISIALAERLYAALYFYQENPDTTIIVSGGQGENETISESLAMQRFLVRKNVPENKILMEDKSTSTEENFKFSKSILDDYFQSKDYKTVFVTNSFHVFRSSKYAKKAGLISHGIPAPSTPYSMTVNYYLREYLAVMYYYAFNK